MGSWVLSTDIDLTCEKQKRGIYIHTYACNDSHAEGLWTLDRIRNEDSGLKNSWPVPIS